MNRFTGKLMSKQQIKNAESANRDAAGKYSMGTTTLFMRKRKGKRQ
ncbi:hypothetical protein [Paenibacillus jamilae]|nr:hypothetical protein [Paenibacillus jamilae]